MANAVFSARFTPNSSTAVNATTFDVSGTLFDGNGLFSAADILVNDVVYMDTFASLTAPGTVSRYKVTAINSRSGFNANLRLLYDDTGDVVDPSEVTGAPGFIARTGPGAGLAWHGIGSLHTFSDYILELARNQESLAKVDGSLGGGGGSDSNGDFFPEFRVITGGEATAKQLTLNNIPVNPTEVLVDVINGGPQERGVDFTITGNVFSWSGLALDGVLTSGDRIRLVYFK